MKRRLMVLALVAVLVAAATACFLLKPDEDGPKGQDEQRDSEPGRVEDRVSQQLVEVFPQKLDMNGFIRALRNTDTA